MSTTTETTTALIRAATAYFDQVAISKRDQKPEEARALALALAADPSAEVIASVRLAPDRAVVLAIVVGGITYIFDHKPVAEVEGVRH